MSQSTIAELKNRLSEMVHKVEKGHDLQITRHGKPVAVIVSLPRYQQAFVSGKGIFTAIQRYRQQLPDAEGFTDKELKQLRDKSSHTCREGYGSYTKDRDVWQKEYTIDSLFDEIESNNNN